MDRWQEDIGEGAVGSTGRGGLWGEKDEIGVSDLLCNQGVAEAREEKAFLLL